MSAPPDIGHLLDILDKHVESLEALPENPGSPDILPECPDIDPEDEVFRISDDLFQGTAWDMEEEAEPAWNDNDLDHEFV